MVPGQSPRKRPSAPESFWRPPRGSSQGIAHRAGEWWSEYHFAMREQVRSVGRCAVTQIAEVAGDLRQTTDRLGSARVRRSPRPRISPPLDHQAVGTGAILSGWIQRCRAAIFHLCDIYRFAECSHRPSLRGKNHLGFRVFDISIGPANNVPLPRHSLASCSQLIRLVFLSSFSATRPVPTSTAQKLCSRNELLHRFWARVLHSLPEADQLLAPTLVLAASDFPF